MLNDREIEAIAQAHVAQEYPSGCEILHREEKSSPLGIYFTAGFRTESFPKPPTNEIISDGEAILEGISGVLFGSGGFFVTRESGEVWQFGSGQIFHEGLEYWLKWYAEGWRPGTYRLIVSEVTHPHRFAELLVKHHFSYRIRELEHGTIWSRIVEYDEEHVLRRLGQLPCAFLAKADQLRAVIPILRGEGVAVFDHYFIGEPRKFDWHPDNTPDDLGQQYD